MYEYCKAILPYIKIFFDGYVKHTSNQEYDIKTLKRYKEEIKTLKRYKEDIKTLKRYKEEIKRLSHLEDYERIQASTQ